MTELKQDNKKKGIMRAILALGVVLITSFVMFFVISQFTSTSAKGIREGNSKQVKSQQQEKKSEPQHRKEKTPDGKPVGKVVYLTFDDGPSTLTGQFLDVLKEQNIKGTFFMQGSNLQKNNYQENVKRAVKEGHYIGGHSMTHDSDKLYKKEQFVPEMKETLSLIHDIAGTNPKLVRPPYGSAPGLKNQKMRDQIVEAGIKVWDWTIDSNDWKLKDNPNQIVKNVKKQTTEDVEVVLMHEKQQTLEALPEIIKFYKEKGYEFGVYNDDDHFHLNFQKDHRL
ncbi:polysaccharide deacetylase family protein [Bacillus thuringiensis]|uniref:polysaccharide deacetylase family protein n=1 Tax=Bacillus thuringiensis TaxID=1428 RepID=UPI0005AEFF6F|nr:polysaccharide deacetylase family protein [Bacillus thuringiensis]KIP29459.1 polysaccharide deacetylase family protein [Bacillus thuringiensis serovar morrisoni]MCT6948013.1 polysaccharide deacetylase [Bacillus thuringiensis]MED2079897.1 polysaccharide deacetylase [Bacillus thuringiensis]MEE2015086.1 polysaccharide deacetylase [Bacillus thuringiensis]NUW50731.1 polysaccharide deacetylase [Bacillus thuringiensis]